MPSDDAYLTKEFRHFAKICAESGAPLYAHLSECIADDPVIRAMAGHNTERQPPSNMLFGAVQYLLLGGAEHDLRAFYPSVGGDREAGDAWPAFRAFCLEHERAIAHLVATRRVQTNEVGRCGPLVIGFGFVQKLFEGKPLAIIEVGASAGLNLGLDRYRYKFSRPRSQLNRTLEPAGRIALPVPTIHTELQGEHALATPIPASMPVVMHRVGIDIAPVSVNDEDALRWVEALIWAEQVDRIELFRSAAAIARNSPPRIIRANAMEVIDAVIAETPSGCVPCVYHTHATYQMTGEWRSAFEDQLAAVARARKCDLAHLSIEWIADDDGPQMRLQLHSGMGLSPRATSMMHLASVHHHGRWIAWRRQAADRGA